MRVKPRTFLLPKTPDPVTRGRAGVIIGVCLGSSGAIFALILIWLVSGDLQAITVAGALAFTAVLIGIVALARRGRVRASAWILIILLTGLITADAGYYGVGSMAVTGFIVPVALAACVLGIWPTVAVALFSSAVIWTAAAGASTGWLTPGVPFEESQLTFNAPVLTVLIWFVGMMVAGWSQYLRGLSGS